MIGRLSAVVFLLGLVALIASLATGQLTGGGVADSQIVQATVAQVDEEADLELTVKSYDVRHLLATYPHKDFAPLGYMREIRYDYYGGGGGSIDIFEDDYDEPDTAVESLRTMIERRVRSKEPWESDGGRGMIDISEREGLMTISQTAAAHAGVVKVLEELAARRTANMVVSIRAVTFKKDVRDRLVDQGTIVARTAAEKHTLRDGVEATHARTTVIGLNGQTLSSNSGTATAFVQDIEPVVAEAAVGWDPTVGHLPGGLATRTLARVFGDKVTLDYTICYARLSDLRQVTIEASVPNQPAEAVVEMLTYDCDQQAGTMTLPLGSTAVIPGGMVPKRLLTGKDKDAETTVAIDYIVTVAVLTN